MCRSEDSGTFVQDSTIAPNEAYTLYSANDFSHTAVDQVDTTHAPSYASYVNTVVRQVVVPTTCNELFSTYNVPDAFSGGGKLLVMGMDWSCDYVGNSEFVPNHTIQPHEYYIVYNMLYNTHTIAPTR
jgi:hypothetical protein